MDPLSHLLSSVRAQASVVHRTVVDPPFGLMIEERAELALATVVSGSCVLVDPGGEVVGLFPGEVALIRGRGPFLLADSPDTPAELVVRPEGLFTPEGLPLPPPLDVSTCELSPEGSTVVVSGSFVAPGQVSGRLLESLPRFAVCRIPAQDLSMHLLDRELDRVAPGRDAALDRWLDLALVTALRVWFEQESHRPGWYAGITHPVVGPALEALHHDLATPWTVAGLARRAAVSRSALSAAFSEVVGEPPMAYLTRSRLDEAADLLVTTSDSLSAVAERVGYGSPFALSAAFKRQHGVSPAQWRRSHQQSA